MVDFVSKMKDVRQEDYAKTIGKKAHKGVVSVVLIPGVRVHKDTLPAPFSEQCRYLLGPYRGLASRFQTLMVISPRLLQLNNSPWIVYVTSAVGWVTYEKFVLISGSMVSLASSRLPELQLQQVEGVVIMIAFIHKLRVVVIKQVGGVTSPIDIVLSSGGG